jgi:hypothetical protein
MRITPGTVGLIVVVSLVAPPAAYSQIQAYGFSASMAGDDDQRDHYGISVGLTESWTFAGADWDNGAGSVAGAAYAMERMLDGSWIINRKLLPDYDSFGAAVAIDGGRVLIGEYGYDVTFEGDEGRAHLYQHLEIFGSGFESGGFGDWSAAVP